MDDFELDILAFQSQKDLVPLLLLKMIRNIVMENPDIKVWNLSLVPAMEIHENFISPEAAELDRIQVNMM